MGSLTEILSTHAGMGEMQLLRPALARVEAGRSLALVNTPHTPSAFCLNQWFGRRHRIFWIQPDSIFEVLWAVEKILQHDACTAVLCWIPQAHATALRRLQHAARQSGSLLFCMRPAHAAVQASPAPLRLVLAPQAFGASVTVLKRQGPAIATRIPLFLRDTMISSHAGQPSLASNHDTLDQHPSFTGIHPARPPFAASGS